MKRICSECKNEMDKGYCLYNGEKYYCSDECLHKNYTNREYLMLYQLDEAYYTEWEENEDE